MVPGGSGTAEHVGVRLDVVTAEFSYLRLIGDRAAVEARTAVFDRTVLDQGPRITRHAELVRNVLDRDIAVFAFANNHSAGFGPDTIKALYEDVHRIRRELAGGGDDP